MNDMMTNLRAQHEAKIEILEDKYNDLFKAFEERPSRPEDLEMIRQLQEEEERRKLNLESSKYTSIKQNIGYQKISTSQPHLGSNSSSHSVEKSKVSKSLYLFLY